MPDIQRTLRPAFVPPSATHAKPAPTSAPLWLTARDARMALERAFGAVRNAGRPGGASLALFTTNSHHALVPIRFVPPRTVDGLLELADDTECELIIISGTCWKLIMHPQLGLATLTENPA